MKSVFNYVIIETNKLAPMGLSVLYYIGIFYKGVLIVMVFIRRLSGVNIDKLTNNSNVELYTLLKADVEAGVVFPAVRANELHFYYMGGCLYKFQGGRFVRDREYAKYGYGTDGLTEYEKAKVENKHKYSNAEGQAKERQLLDKLYLHTFALNRNSKAVVLDIEVSINGKKCDLVLLNTETDEIMFVEGKVFSDPRVKCEVGRTPEVIEQVKFYTSSIAEHREAILTQYAKHIRIVNQLFGTHYKPPKSLIQPAKLLVYETGGGKADNASYSMKLINEYLGVENIMWVEMDRAPTIDEIWDAFR